MLLDASHVGPDAVVEADVCIIGAGAAGITLAREFIGQSQRVCLLESGGLQTEAETQALCKGNIIGHTYVELDGARLRYFGGTTNHWAGNCRPLSSIDFEERDWVPHSGWPFDLQHLTPFYERAQPICQIGPFAYEARDWATREMGPLQFASDALATRVTQFSPPTRFGLVYGDEIKRAPNVAVYLHANVVDIETTESAQAVTRLAVATLAGGRFWVKAKAYVLAAGGIENARILLYSNRVQQAGLGNGHDLVGRYFMEHLSLDVGLLLPSSQDLSRLDFYEVSDRRLGHFPPPRAAIKAYLGLSGALQRREKTTDATATLNRLYLPPSHSSRGYLSMKDLADGGTDNGFWKDLRNVIDDFDDLASGVYWKLFEEDRPLRLFSVHVQAEQTPNPDSRVLLGSERDKLGKPRVQLDWRLSPLDAHTLRRFSEILALEFGRAGLGRVMITTHDDDAKMLASVGGDWHHMGTTRMHRDPQQGVVDPDCRVHGVGNLFVAGSSVFPTGGHSVPTLTIVAMAVRLADHLKRSLSSL
jgi:choline dehydrogenase-like flavoprotein